MPDVVPIKRERPVLAELGRRLRQVRMATPTREVLPVYPRRGWALAVPWMTTREASVLLGASAGAVSMWENAIRSPSVERLDALCQLYGRCTVADLFADRWEDLPEVARPGTVAA